MPSPNLNGSALVSQKLQGASFAIAEKYDADVLIFNGPIRRPIDTRLINLCYGKEQRRKNLFWLVVTEGGDPDAAYRMARTLQSLYGRITCLISGFCKSAGTLAVIGSHELVFGPHGELGPVDIQMSKKDDLYEMQSGQTVMSALATLQEKAFQAFEQCLLEVQERSGGRITLKLATEVAVKLSSSLFAPIYQQIDPMHIGEAGRASSITTQYGQRLDNRSRNLKPNALEYLMSGYTSHGFVIDEAEASLLFKSVKSAEAEELALCLHLGDEAQMPLTGNRTDLQFLPSIIEARGKNAERDNQRKTSTGSGSRKGAAPSDKSPTGNGANPRTVPGLRSGTTSQ